ncbi:hypothetical protein BC628DRAFT_133500 [Trametes gibbosa]|nr:hypothetical protein BC628DRAFT_133500 [Trametes gibbosa]
MFLMTGTIPILCLIAYATPDTSPTVSRGRLHKDSGKPVLISSVRSQRTLACLYSGVGRRCSELDVPNSSPPGGENEAHVGDDSRSAACDHIQKTQWTSDREAYKYVRFPTTYHDTTCHASALSRKCYQRKEANLEASVPTHLVPSFLFSFSIFWPFVPGPSSSPPSASEPSLPKVSSSEVSSSLPSSGTSANLGSHRSSPPAAHIPIVHRKWRLRKKSQAGSASCRCVGSVAFASTPSSRNT